jgi:hypothetical protein
MQEQVQFAIQCEEDAREIFRFYTKDDLIDLSVTDAKIHNSTCYPVRLRVRARLPQRKDCTFSVRCVHDVSCITHDDARQTEYNSRSLIRSTNPADG